MSVFFWVVCVVRCIFLSSLRCYLFQDIWAEGFYVIARAKARSNPAFGDLLRSKFDRVKKSEMSGFCNKNVRLFALFVLIFAPESYCWASMPNLQAILSKLYFETIFLYTSFCNNIKSFRYFNAFSDISANCNLL